jgi:hypothetical protein
MIASPPPMESGACLCQILLRTIRYFNTPERAILFQLKQRGVNRTPPDQQPEFLTLVACE